MIESQNSKKNKIRSDDQQTLSAWVKTPHVKLNENNSFTISPEKAGKENQENVGNILGGKRDGISRLLFPNKMKPESKKIEKIITAENGKKYKLSHFFSSDEE